jgi:hypothetical protein
LAHWTTTWIGISLPIKNWAGGDFHEIQFWEDPAESIQFEHTAVEVYNWLTARLFGRSREFGRLPIGMPETFKGLSVTTYRTGEAGYILFTLLNSFADSLRDQPVKVEVNYHWSYTRIGMGDRYTLRMLATELWTLTRNDWQVYPRSARETRADGTVVHDSSDTSESFRQTFLDSFAEAPPKVVVGTPRGSSIKSPIDQALLLQYFAWAGQAFDVGSAFSVDNHQVEYWFNVTLQPQPDDEGLQVYVADLKGMWFERLSELSTEDHARRTELRRLSWKSGELRGAGYAG